MWMLRFFLIVDIYITYGPNCNNIKKNIKFFEQCITCLYCHLYHVRTSLIWENSMADILVYHFNVSKVHDYASGKI